MPVTRAVDGRRIGGVPFSMEGAVRADSNVSNVMLTRISHEYPLLGSRSDCGGLRWLTAVLAVRGRSRSGGTLWRG